VLSSFRRDGQVELYLGRYHICPSSEDFSIRFLLSLAFILTRRGLYTSTLRQSNRHHWHSFGNLPCNRPPPATVGLPYSIVNAASIGGLMGRAMNGAYAFALWLSRNSQKEPAALVGHRKGVLDHIISIK
jgi:hypothetical protein